MATKCRLLLWVSCSYVATQLLLSLMTMQVIVIVSRLTVVSREAKRKQHACASSGLATTTVSYLHGWQL